jgi:hypothetical protein
MEAAERDYRPLGFAVIALLLVMAMALVFTLRPRTRFRQEHARAEAANPTGVSVEISTPDHGAEYRENEPINIVVRFSSTQRYRYKIQAAEGENVSTVDVLHISNGQKALRNIGIACCSSRLVGLDDEPYSSKQRMPLKLPPGKYEIYLTSRRVFPWKTETDVYDFSWIEVASNILSIRVVPDRK